MDEAVSCISAVLQQGEAQARHLLAMAEAQGIDPLELAAQRFGIGAGKAWGRAAAWAGLAFSESIPKGALVAPTPRRLDMLATARTAAGRIFDRRVTFIAPRFSEVLALRRALAGGYRPRNELCVVPPARLRAALAQRYEKALIAEAQQRLVRRWPTASAHFDLSLGARICFLIGGSTLFILVLAAPFIWQPVLLPIVAALMLVPAALRYIAVSPGLVPPPLAPISDLDDADLPVYSVLVPLRDEAGMVPNLKRSLSRLDYPPEKLDIKFVVEGRSERTIEAVSAILDDPRFELIAVPDTAPRTKPKALNYALPFVRGEYVVVFDAEDIPEPRQLREAASLFARHAAIDCLQAELVIDNADENWLTAMFAAEYAGLFGFMLPALAFWRLPMPLGGTSNHFRVQSLRELGGWDSYNVTEDADLGVRLARLRYRSASFAAKTREEAPITLRMWYAQRSRWMKGWMQTFIVHNRHPLIFRKDIGWRGFLAFEIYVGSLIISPLLHTTFLVIAVMKLLHQVQHFGDGIDVYALPGIFILLFGYGGALALVSAGLRRLERRGKPLIYLTLPGYWALHSAATVRAGFELLVRPTFWAKTEHGRSKIARNIEGGRALSEGEASQSAPISGQVEFFPF